MSLLPWDAAENSTEVIVFVVHKKSRAANFAGLWNVHE